MKQWTASKNSFSGFRPKYRTGKRDFSDLIGHQFGRLYVEKLIAKQADSLFLCRCSCGKRVVKTRSYLRLNSQTKYKSCGCWKSEVCRERARLNREKIDYSKVGRKSVKWRLTRKGQKLAEKNLNLVFSIFRDFTKYSFDLDEILSAGFISLVSSAYWFLERTDIDCDFIRFASVRIKCAMKRSIKKQYEEYEQIKQSIEMRKVEYLSYTLSPYKMLELKEFITQEFFNERIEDARRNKPSILSELQTFSN